jgi:dsDNA-specific endonuclease/ATPase MutS2
MGSSTVRDWWINMAKQTQQDRFDGLISKLWLKEQFDQIHKADALILERLKGLDSQGKLILAGVNDIKKILDKTKDLVIPELEAAVKLVSISATAIDQKVPDTARPPPSSRPPPSRPQ